MDFFSLKLHNTTFKTEVFAGISIFFSIAYILVLNPIILSETGMNRQGVFAATAIATILTTLIGAFYARMPLVYAPGLGLNSLFVAVVANQFHGSWQMGLLATYISGILIVILVSHGFYERVVESIPYPIRMGIIAGLGLGIVRVGLEASGLIIKSTNGFYIYGTVTSNEFLCSVVGLILILILKRMKFRCAISLGLLATYLCGMGITLIEYINTTGLGIAEFIIDKFSYRWDFNNLSAVAFQFPRIEDVFRSLSIVIELIVVIFVMSITHFFDAVGTITATTSMLQKEDINFNDQYMKRCIKTNGIGSIISACLGTSSVTIYAESTIGIMDGSKTGLCAVVVAVCMFLALILAPLITTMTTFVMAPALIFVGGTLIKYIKSIQRARPIEGLTSLIVFMYLGLTFKIAEAVLYGMLFYIVLMTVRGKIKQLNRYSFLLLALSLVYILLQLL